MGLLSKFKNVFSTSSEAPASNASLEEVRKEMRSQSRYPVDLNDDATVIMAGGWEGRIIDISYGGIAVSFSASKCDLTMSVPVMSSCKLEILGKAHQFQLKTVRTIPNGKDTLYVGFCFEHSAPDTLIFLREIIEPIRNGRSLEELSSEFKSDQYKDKNWHCLRGDGPVDIVLMTDESKTKVVEALLTLKSGDSYYEVGIRSGKLWTSKSVGGTTSQLMGGARMTPSVTPDIMVLRKAFLIVASAPIKSSKTIRPFLELISKAIREHKNPAA
jgi:hypothetical protein